MLFLIEKFASKIKRQASFLHIVNHLHLIAMAQKMFGEKNGAAKTFTLWVISRVTAIGEGAPGIKKLICSQKLVLWLQRRRLEKGEFSYKNLFACSVSKRIIRIMNTK